MKRRHFFVREMVENGEIRVPFVGTLDNLADFFTKPLAPKQFMQMRAVIMNLDDGPVGAWGGVDFDSLESGAPDVLSSS